MKKTKLNLDRDFLSGKYKPVNLGYIKIGKQGELLCPITIDNDGIVLGGKGRHLKNKSIEMFMGFEFIRLRDFKRGCVVRIQITEHGFFIGVPEKHKDMVRFIPDESFVSFTSGFSRAT